MSKASYRNKPSKIKLKLKCSFCEFLGENSRRILEPEVKVIGEQRTLERHLTISDIQDYIENDPNFIESPQDELNWMHYLNEGIITKSNLPPKYPLPHQI